MRASVSFYRALIPRVLPAFSRLKSTTPSLTAQIFPLEKESITERDVDEWLSAVRALRKGGHRPDSEAEVYLSQLTDPEPFLEQKFVPTEEQVQEVKRFADLKLPLKEDPSLSFFVNLIMRHGEKAKARKVVNRALYFVYLKTRTDPVRVFYEVLEKMSPVFTIMTKKTGFAKNILLPAPLTKRQRERQVILWLLEGSQKKKSNELAVRLGEEIIAAWEGKSSGYEKRARLHKSAIAQRSFIKL